MHSERTIQVDLAVFSET